MRHAFLLTTLFMAGLLSACSSDQGEEAAPAAAAPQAETRAAPAAGGPKLSVNADKTHAVQPNDEITLTISATGFSLDASQMGQANEAGTGHYRIYLDTAQGDDYLAAGAEATVKVTIPADITDGSHDLRVVLHNNDYTPVAPAVEETVLLIVYRL